MNRDTKSYYRSSTAFLLGAIIAVMLFLQGADACA